MSFYCALILYIQETLKKHYNLYSGFTHYRNYRAERAWFVQVLFSKFHTELDFLGHSARMTVSADLAQLVEQRTRNA